MSTLLNTVTAVAGIILIVVMYNVFKKPKEIPPPVVPVRDRSLRGLINDIGSNAVYRHRECQAYHLLDPVTNKTHTVYVGSESQFNNTKRYQITYTTLLTPIGSAIGLHCRLYVMYPEVNSVDLLKRLISNTSIRYLPLEIINEGAICNGGVFVEQDELNEIRRDCDDVIYY